MDLSIVKSYLGIDLAGYTANRTAVVKLELEGERAIFKILRNHPFNSYNPKSSFQDQIRSEACFLYDAYHKWLCHIVIDAPIDLNQMKLDLQTIRFDNPVVNSKVYNPRLPNNRLTAKNLTDCWQLQKRPIDKALGGMPPIHSNLGIVTKRAELALSRSYASESYPKISKRLIGYRENKIANKLFEFKEFLQTIDVNLASAVLSITEDELDAMFCALAGLLGTDAVVTEHEVALKNIEYVKLTKNSFVKWPDYYRLLIAWPQSIKSILICEGTNAPGL